MSELHITGNNFGYDRMMMDQDLPYYSEGQVCTQLSEPRLL